MAGSEAVTDNMPLFCKYEVGAESLAAEITTEEPADMVTGVAVLEEPAETGIPNFEGNVASKAHLWKDGGGVGGISADALFHSTVLIA